MEPDQAQKARPKSLQTNKCGVIVFRSCIAPFSFSIASMTRSLRFLCDLVNPFESVQFGVEEAIAVYCSKAAPNTMELWIELHQIHSDKIESPQTQTAETMWVVSN